MGKTNNLATCFMPGGGFSRLRGHVAKPQGRSPIDFVWYLPENGVADLREHPDHQPLPPELIPAVAPLSAVTDNREQAAAIRGRLLEETEGTIFGNPSFLGGKYATSSQKIALYYRGRASTIDRQRTAEQRQQRQLSPDIDKRPLEILVREKYLPEVPANSWDFGLGVAHYVYDPLTFRWLLVNRWGRGAMKKRTQTIEPYVQTGALINRQYSVLEQIESADPPAPDEQQLVCATPEQISEQIVRWRQGQQGLAAS